MHEIRASLPEDCVSEVVQIAFSVSIERVAVSKVFLHGPEIPARIVSVETSTPKARAFVEKFLFFHPLEAKLHADIPRIGQF